jgi:serine/threonine protein kinase
MSSAVYDYIQDISDLSNNLYEYKTLKSKKALGDELIKTLDKYNCDPEKVLYKMTNGSNKYGFRLMKIVSDAPLRLKYNSAIEVGRGIGMIGKGAYGTVYIGCIDKACKKEVAIKMADAKENRLEYNFLKKFIGVSPHITHAYYYKKCDAPVRSVLYLEYYSFGSIKRLLGKYADKLRKLHYRVILFHVIWTLAALNKKFPTFRHNDLHLDNVFIDDRVTTKGSIRYGDFTVPNIGMNAVLGDFGFANMQADGFKNAKVQSGEYKAEYGIVPDSDYRYDLHFFLSDLYTISADADVRKFIKRHIPPDYLVPSSSVVNKNRLRYGVDHSRLPTFDQILNDKIFRFFTPRGNTVIPPINTFPKNLTRPPSSSVTKRPPSSTKVSRKSPIQTLSPTKPTKKVVARLLINSPKKVSPRTFKPENVKKYMAIAPPVIRTGSVAPTPKSRLVQPQINQSKLKKPPLVAKRKVQTTNILRNSPNVVKLSGAKIRFRLNAARVGVILHKNYVKFKTNVSAGKKCDTFKKDEIVARAKLLGIIGVESMSKEKICAMIKNALA